MATAQEIRSLLEETTTGTRRRRVPEEVKGMSGRGVRAAEGSYGAIGLNQRRDVGSDSPRELTRCTFLDVNPPLFFLPASH